MVNLCITLNYFFLYPIGFLQIQDEKLKLSKHIDDIKSNCTKIEANFQRQSKEAEIEVEKIKSELTNLKKQKSDNMNKISDISEDLQNNYNSEMGLDLIDISRNFSENENNFQIESQENIVNNMERHFFT